MTTFADEDWVKSAMSDDTIVVNLLVHLNRTQPPPPPKVATAAALPLGWSVRQRRSKPVSVNNNNPKKPPHRGSPTTPLSWSGGATSLSGGSAEESSRLLPFKLSNTTRSKVNTDSEKTASKRSRRKKSLFELKDEEKSLLKERRELKKEMAFLRSSLERQRATNENLKRMKIEMQPRTEKASIPEESISGQLPITMPAVASNLVKPTQNADEESESKFILPDLNMPFDEEPSSEAICGVS